MRKMPRSPGGVSRVAHGACPAPPPHDPPDTPVGRRIAVPLNPPKSCRASPHAVGGLESRPPKVRPAPGWKPWNRRRDARRAPGGIWPLLFVVSYYSNVGPSQNFSYTPADSISKIGGGHTAACCPGRVGQTTRPPPPKVAHQDRATVEALPARSGACWPMADSHPPNSWVNALISLDIVQVRASCPSNGPLFVRASIVWHVR